MAIGKIVAALNDFSAGEVDITAKRSSDPVTLTGGRQALNWRLLNGHKKANRPGRSALFFEGGRVDKVMMSPGNAFYLAFGQNYLTVYNAAGTQVFSTTKKGDGTTNIPWTIATAKNITWAAGSNSLAIYICYDDDTPLNVPQVLTWDGVSQSSSWTLTTYAVDTTGHGKRTAFYRLSPQAISLQPSGVTGNINLTFSAPVLTSGMVGTYLRWCFQQIIITAVTLADFTTPTAGPSQYGTASVVQGLPVAQTLGLTSFTGTFVVGDVVIGSLSGAKGIVTNFNAGGSGLTAQLIPNANGQIVGFFSDASENLAGPTGSAKGVTVGSTAGPQAVTLWDQEVTNNYRGWPKSVFFDQSRLGFCNLPALPSAITWSVIGNYNDFYPDATSADNSIFELVPGKSQVRYVVPGMESSEFVFCDDAIYYIPINVTDPLKPGGVAFNKLSSFGCAPVQPRRAEQTVVYMKSGGLQVGVVQAPGAYYRPYVIDDISEAHSHLFSASAPVAIAIPSASTQFEELYIYVLLANGTMVSGKYMMRQGLIEPGQDGKPKVGWCPWNGAGVANWISALDSALTINTSYTIAGAATFSVTEQLDATQYLDSAVSVNNLSPAIAAQRPLGKGPLWFVAGGTVELIDLGTRFMNTYKVDANGWIIPQNIGGENLLSAQLVAGQPWTAIYEPFIPHAPAGQDGGQRMRRRKVVRFAASVVNSSGFSIGSRRIPPYFVDDDPTKAAPLREGTFSIRPRGRSYDPRVQVMKDTPGPLTVLEYSIEVTV